jgi:hypothetical protein
MRWYVFHTDGVSIIIILTKHLRNRGSTPNPISLVTLLQYNVQGVAGIICLTPEEHLLSEITAT